MMILFAIALVFAVLDWTASFYGWQRVGYLTKPAVMLALIGWLLSFGWPTFPLGWFLVALLCSLVGDVLLMLPRERFLAGLLAFLLAHLAYILGWNPSPPPLNLASLLTALMVGITGGRLLRILTAHVSPTMRTPVLVYAGALSLMLLSALLTLVRNEWQAQAALESGLGAFLFFLSDTLLAWDRFVRPLRHARLKVHATYHLGQMLIVLGAATHYLGLPTWGA